MFRVKGSFYARRDYWQNFSKQHEAESSVIATDWALSEIGGCHSVKRHLIRIESVSEITVAPTV